MLGIEEIKKILPHRAPMLLIDRVEELNPGVSAVAYKAVSYNEPFFLGHYPDYPVMPGVLIVEALAQTGAVAVMSCEKFQNKLAFYVRKKLGSFGFCHDQAGSVSDLVAIIYAGSLRP